eukprot:10845846-Lingulodinium_polyedra.AAC.1
MEDAAANCRCCRMAKRENPARPRAVGTWPVYWPLLVGAVPRAAQPDPSSEGGRLAVAGSQL